MKSCEPLKFFLLENLDLLVFEMKNIWSICIYLVTTRSYCFSHDAFIAFRLWSFHTLLATTCLRISDHNPFATFRSRPFGHVPFALLCHDLFATFRSWPFASFWSRPIYTLLVTFMTLLHPFGYDPLASFRS